MESATPAEILCVPEVRLECRMNGCEEVLDACTTVRFRLTGSLISMCLQLIDQDDRWKSTVTTWAETMSVYHRREGP